MEEIRNLCSIEKVLKIEPIEKADKIECVTVKGWTLVCKKGDFKVGDLCVYFEIDSLMPKLPCFEFLEPRKYKIKAAKLRGCYSYGIAFPLSILDECLIDGWQYKDNKIISNLKTLQIVEGLKLDETIDVKKYNTEDGESKEEVLFRANPKKSWIVNKFNFYRFRFKSFINKFNKKKNKERYPTDICPKSDESRAQNLQSKLDEYVGTPCYITEKVEGQSTTFFVKKRKGGIKIFNKVFFPKMFKFVDYGVCSRNLRLNPKVDNNFWFLSRKYNVENKLKSLGINIAIQAEHISPTVQGNLYELEESDMRVFTVYFTDERRYANYNEFIEITTKLDLPIVPIISDNYVLSNDIQEIVNLSKGYSKLHPKKLREGIVIRSREPINDKNQIFSFKAINPDYIINQKED